MPFSLNKPFLPPDGRQAVVWEFVSLEHSKRHGESNTSWNIFWNETYICSINFARFCCCLVNVMARTQFWRWHKPIKQMSFFTTSIGGSWEITRSTPFTTKLSFIRCGAAQHFGNVAFCVKNLGPKTQSTRVLFWASWASCWGWGFVFELSPRWSIFGCSDLKKHHSIRTTHTQLMVEKHSLNL